MGIKRQRPLRSNWVLLLYLAASETAAGQPVTKNSRQLRGNTQLERRQQATTVTPLDNLFRQNVLSSTPTTKQANGAGTYLKVDVTFKVGSTSVSETKHSVDIADLTAALNLFATTLTLEWAYRRLEQFTEEEENNALGSLRALANINDEITGTRKRRRLELSAVPDSAVVDESLEDAIGCIVSVTDVGEGEFSHCNQASGSFVVFADEEEDPPRVCWNMEDSVNGLFGDDYLQEALDILAPQSSLKLSEGAFSSCTPVTDFKPPGVTEETNGTSLPAPTSAPTSVSTSTPTSQAPTPVPTATITSPSNIFNQPGTGANSSSSQPTSFPITSPPAGNATDEPDTSNNPLGTNTTIIPSIAPTMSPSVSVPTVAPGPVPTGSPTVYQNQWLSVLNGDYEDDPTETGDPWLDALDAAAAEEEEGASGGPGTPEPAPANNSEISEEIARLREAYYDDSTLDFAILILSIVWGSLIFIACCVYAMDAAWIQYRRSKVAAEDKEFFHEGRWYYDENHRFLREDSHEKPPPDGFSQSSMFDVGNEFSEDDDDGDDDSIFMSSSEDDEDDDDDDYFDFDESDVEEDESDGSEFYVEYGEVDGEDDDDFFGDGEDEEEDEEEDYFADEVGEEMDDFGEETDEEEARGFGDESNESDFFNDESELTDISDIPEQKPEPLLKSKR